MNELENFFEERLLTLSRIFTPERVFLALLILGGTILIFLGNSGVLPLSLSYTTFYFGLLFLLGLYRPSLLWQAVVFFLPFEIIAVSNIFGMDLRAYQLGVLALVLATGILWLQRKVSYTPIRWFDVALAFVLVGAVISFFTNQLPFGDFQEVAVLLSYGVVYAVGRIYVRSKEDVRNLAMTLFSSGIVVALYALYQAIAFQHYLQHYMVMPGRPNSVFQEADWLGFFLGLIALLAFVCFLRGKSLQRELLYGFLLYLFLLVGILTVSRSAWLGFLVASGIIGLLLLFQCASGFLKTKEKDYRSFGKLLLAIPGIFLFAIGTIFFFELTRFDLDQRFTSTGSGNQVITIACTGEKEVPSYIENISTLPEFGCQHINLEDQERFRAEGFDIATTERPDPNINIRKNLYKQSREIIIEDPVFGIGWGQSLRIFGMDGRGAGLNSSNLFIEVWLGSGIIGVMGMLIFFLGLIVTAVSRHFRKREMTEGYWISLGIIGIWIHVVIFNLFNAGIFLGIFALFLVYGAWYLEKTLPHLRNLWQK